MGLRDWLRGGRPEPDSEPPASEEPDEEDWDGADEVGADEDDDPTVYPLW